MLSLQEIYTVILSYPDNYLQYVLNCSIHVKGHSWWWWCVGSVMKHFKLKCILKSTQDFFYTAHCSILFRRNKQQMRNKTTIKLLLFGVPEM